MPVLFQDDVARRAFCFRGMRATLRRNFGEGADDIKKRNKKVALSVGRR
jgi:hypothetical protein